MCAERKSRRSWPWSTTVVVGITAVLTAVQFICPGLLTVMERRPDMWRSHEYWRLFSPLFVHSDGWKQILFNFPAIICVGAAVEWIYGARLWLVCYFVPGIVAELFAYVWQPTGAGASVAGAGLLGALALYGLLRAAAPQARFGAAFVLLASFVLTSVRDIHGPPALVGACIGLTAIHLGFVRPRVESFKAITPP